MHPLGVLSFTVCRTQPSSVPDGHRLHAHTPAAALRSPFAYGPSLCSCLDKCTATASAAPAQLRRRYTNMQLTDLRYAGRQYAHLERWLVALLRRRLAQLRRLPVFHLLHWTSGAAVRHRHQHRQPARSLRRNSDGSGQPVAAAAASCPPHWGRSRSRGRGGGRGRGGHAVWCGCAH